MKIEENTVTWSFQSYRPLKKVCLVLLPLFQNYCKWQLTEKWPFTLVLRMLYPYKITLQFRFALLLNFTIGTSVVTLVTFRNLLLYPKGIVNLFVWERHCMSFLLGCNFQITFTHPISTHIFVHMILKIIVCIFLICLHFGPTNKRV